MIEIDGSYGEGGGQIFRTALIFSAILNRPMRVSRIRAGRKNPGLRPQHLRAVEALAKISGAWTEGLGIGADTITFVPQEVLPGDYQFDIGTGGSVTLLLQALLAPLALAGEKSRLTLIGGTHVPWSPPYHYVDKVLFPALQVMGVDVRAHIERWGWYPRGGGMVKIEIQPCSEFKPATFIDRGSLKNVHGLSATSLLPGHVADRQKNYAVERLEKEVGLKSEIEILEDAPANGPGSFLFIEAEFEGGIAGFSSLGERGKKAEQVAKEAVDSFKGYLEAEGCVDPYLADQLVPFMGLAKGSSAFTTTRITEHLLTNLWVIQHFADVKITRTGDKGEPGRLDIIRN